MNRDNDFHKMKSHLDEFHFQFIANKHIIRSSLSVCVEAMTCVSMYLSLALFLCVSYSVRLYSL